jgi:sterol desaturase/sphingolipid hydroxylase (fatty acid hydroxylase superfamily)
MTATEAATAEPRKTPITIIGMSGLREIVMVSTGISVLYALIAVFWTGAPLTVAAVMFAGLLYWTLLEYILHRWMLHWEPQEKWKRVVRKCFPSHRSHHDDPLKERMNVMLQLKITVYLTLAYTAFMWAVGLPLAYALALNAGVLFGYQAYEYVHVACHHLPMRNAWAATLKRHHAIHHYRDETVNFGVTTTFWDHVFRTMWRGPVKVPAA